MTRLILTNAIYFKGDWATPFKLSRTREKDFHLPNGTVAQVPMMSHAAYQDAKYAAFQADGTVFASPDVIRQRQTEGLYPDDGFSVVAPISVTTPSST